MGSLAAGSAFTPTPLFSERFRTLGLTRCSQQLVWAFPSQPWTQPLLQSLAVCLETASGCLFLGGRFMGDLLSQTEPVWEAPQAPGLVQLACLRGPGAAPGGHIGPRPPALLAGLQGRHLQGSQHRSERDERGTQTRVQWARSRDPGASEPLSGQVATARAPCWGLDRCRESRGAEVRLSRLKGRAVTLGGELARSCCGGRPAAQTGVTSLLCTAKNACEVRRQLCLREAGDEVRGPRRTRKTQQCLQTCPPSRRGSGCP